MKFKSILCLLVLLMGCAREHTQSFTSQKSVKRDQYQSAACSKMSINGLLGLNGEDIYYLPSCLSGRDENGNLVSLDATNNLMESMGVDAVINAANLVKSNPEGGEGLPVLKNIMVLMERGTIVDGKSNKALEDKMFGGFQDFLFSMDPYWVSHLIIQMAQTGTLVELLDEVAPFVNSIDMQPIFGQMRLFLGEKELKDSIVYAAERVVNTSALHDSFKNILTFEKSFNLSEEAKERYLDEWLDPHINDIQEDDIGEMPEKNSIGKKQSGLERYREFIADLGQEDISRFTKISSELFKRFATMDSEDRLSVIKKLFDGFSEAYMEQAGPVRNIVALMDFLANKTKVSDLENVVTGISELLEGTGPAAILSLNHKVASAKLHALADKILYEGGPVPGCGGLALTGLKNVDPSKFSAVQQSISLFLVPNNRCRSHLSPLASLVITELEESLNISSECQNGLCFQPSEIAQISDRLNSFNWSEVTSPVEVEPSLLKRFLVESLDQLIVGLEKDSYALYWDHLSIGEVPASVLRDIIDRIHNVDELTASTVAELDQAIETEDPFRRYFHPHFLETILANRIALLSAQAEQFGNIFENSQKAERIFAGAYSGGPLEKMIGNALDVPALSANLQLPKIEFRVRELLARLKRPGNLFKDNRLDYYEDTLPLKFVGERTRSMEYAFEKGSDPETGDMVYKFSGVEFIKDPTTLSNLFDNEYWRLKNLLTSDQLIGKDIAHGRSDEFISWVENRLYPYLTEEKDWLQISQREQDITGFSRDYYDIEPYSVNELRKIALFYSQNFMMAPGFLPAGEHFIEKVRTSRRPDVKLQFSSLPFDRSESKWTTFNKYFPDSLSAAKSYSSILAGVTKEDLDSIDWTQLPMDKSGSYELGDFTEEQLDIIRVLSTLNLLSVNRSKEYVPAVALGNYCHYKGDAKPCPITFLDGESQAIDNLKKYVRRVAGSYFCPMTNSLDYSFSKEMRQALDMNELPSNICDNTENLFKTQIADNEQLPLWLHKTILGDVVNMGRKAELKPGLSTLTAKIRYHRLLKKYPRDMKQLIFGMSNAQGVLPVEMSAYALKQMADHKGFLVYQPGYINVYINYLTKSIASTGYAEELLAYYGAGVTVQQNLAEGVGQSLLDEVLIGTFNETVDKNASALDFLFRVVQKLAKPEYKEHLEAIANIVAYPQDLEALSTYTKTVPLLIKHLSTFNMAQPFWQRPGNSIIRHIILHQEKMRSLNDLLYDFSSVDITDALQALVETFYILGPSEDVTRMVKKSVKFAKNQLIASKDDGEGTITNIEKNLRRIMLEDALDMDFRSVNNVINTFVRPSSGFDGEPAEPLINQIQIFLEYGVRHLPNLLGLYQKHFELSKVDEKEDYLKTVVNSLTTPMKGFLGDLGATTLVTLLGNSDFGKWETFFKPLLFESKYQDMVVNLVKASDKPSIEEYQETMAETQELLPSMNRYLNFVVNNAEWSDESSAYGLESLLRLSGQNDKVLGGQVNLMMNWLEKAQNNK